MSADVIQSNVEFGKKIRLRRNELGLTIEDAAKRAGVGTKTWSRYESGGAIRKDKYKGLCNVLGWSYKAFSDEEDKTIDEYRREELWSTYLEKTFGEEAAFSFVVGSDLLLDAIISDMDNLAKMPKATHLGQLDFSELLFFLPEQFTPLYDYDLLYFMKSRLLLFRRLALENKPIFAKTVMDEIVFYIIVQQAVAFVEIVEMNISVNFEEWIFDMFGDMDVITWLYSDMYVDVDNIYHVEHWKEAVFYEKYC